MARAADVATMADVSWFNQTAGTFYIEGDSQDVTGAVFTSWVFIGDATDLVSIDRFSTDVAFRWKGGVANAEVVLTGADDTLSTTKIAGAYAEDDVAASRDGAAVNTDTDVDLPDETLATLRIGSSHNATLNGHIGRITYWSIRRPDADLVSLTS